MAKTFTLDYFAEKAIEENINMIVPWYLMAACAYYKEDSPILSDDLFDNMAKKMLNEYDTIEHYHKELITKEDLSAGTYLGKYPERVAGGLRSLRKTYRI